jgi:S-adenosylmethionine synthetase
VLHHNVDKVLLCGGAARPRFGGGELLEPIELYLAGRATAEHGGARVPVHELAADACREWLAAHLPGLDPERDVRIVSRLRPVSTDLSRLFERGATRPLSNDTSCGAGFAPLTPLEQAVLAVERALNAPETKEAHPELGADVKVMGVRRGERVHLTVACAFVSRFVSSLDDYVGKKAAACALAVEAARSATSLPVDVTLNGADDLQRGDVYLTVSGTSAEAGDDGEVGRGNRVSGLITPARAMTLEAAAGKNPVSHVGKLYNLLAPRIARAAVSALPGVSDATCVMVSQIGRPVDDPQLVDLAVAGARELRPLEGAALELVRAELARLPALRQELLSEQLPVY